MGEISFWGDQGPEDDGSGDPQAGGGREERPQPEEPGGDSRPKKATSSSKQGGAGRSAKPVSESERPGSGGGALASKAGRKQALNGWIYDPTTMEMLRSEEGTDRPPKNPFEYVSGVRHPTLADLERYRQEFEPGSLELPSTVPLLRGPDQTGGERMPHYNLSLVWQSRERATHTIVFGKTGGGKNTRFIDLTRYSAICDPAQIVISVSLKASDYGPIKVACEQAGKRCLVVNFADDWRSVGFNPLSSASENEAPDIIRRFAESSRNPRSGDSEFWTQMLRTGLMALYEGGYRSFPEMFRFFCQSRKAMVRGLEALQNSHSTKMGEFLVGGSWNADTTEATITGSFVAFQQESVQRVMSRDELRLDRLFEEPIYLQIEVDEATLETTLPLVQMLLRSVIDRLIATAQRLGAKALPATIFIDDLPSVGAVFSVERLLTLRSRKVGVIAGCQSIAALSQAFPNSGAAILEAFANQIALPGCSPEDAEYFSRSSGQQLVRLSGSGGHPPHYLTMPLLSPTDIRTPEYGHFLLGRPLTFLLGDIAFQAYVQHSFEVPAWRAVLAKAREITGTERLRRRRLPNLFKTESKRMERRLAAKAQRVKLTFPFHFRDADLKDWSDEDLQQGIRQGLLELGYEKEFSWVRSWWDAYVKDYPFGLRGALRLVSQLIEFKLGLGEYFHAQRATPEIDPEVLVAQLNYAKKLAAAEQRRIRAASKTGGRSDSNSDARAGTHLKSQGSTSGRPRGKADDETTSVPF